MKSPADAFGREWHEHAVGGKRNLSGNGVSSWVGEIFNSLRGNTEKGRGSFVSGQLRVCSAA